MARKKLTSVDLMALKNAQGDGVFTEDFVGKRVCLTGTMSMDRRDIVHVLELLGATWDRDIRPGTHVLVVGDTGIHGITDKIEKANDLGIRVMHEEEFATRLLVV